MAFPATALNVTVEAAWGADLTADPTTWTWAAITSDVLIDPPITITRGRSDGNAAPEACKVAFTLKNLSGQYTPFNPTGTNYPNVRQNTPIRVRVDNGGGPVTRASAYVDSWVPDWDVALRRPVVRVQASGLLRRLSKGAELPKSTITEWHLQDPQPVAYWPMEDPVGSTSFASAIGGTAATFSGGAPTLASAAPGGSDNLPSLATDTNIEALLPTYKKATAWTVMAVVRVPAGPSVDTPVINIRTNSPVVQWRIALYPNGGSTDQIAVEAWDSGGSAVVADAVTFTAGSLTEPYGRFLLLVLQAQQSGTSINYTQITYDCDTGVSTSNTGTITNTLGNVLKVQVLSGWDHASWVFGHFAVYNYVLTPATDILNGLLGQTAADRITDVCADHDIPFALVGTASDTQTMGVRPKAGIVAILDECEAADGGILYDGLTPQLEYRTRYDRYNIAATLTLSMASGQVSPPFQAPHDDQRIRNDWTVNRAAGSSGQDSDEDHVDEHGRYDDTTTINVETDDVLVDQAGWRVNLGTVEQLRYPTLDFDLARAPSLINTWMTVDVGDRITVTNVPSGHPPGNIDLILEGYTERMSAKRWNVSCNCSPYRPWEVFTVEDTRLGRLDTGGSELNADCTSAATSLKVATTDPDDDTGWITGESFDIEVGGEQMTVTAVAAASPSFVAAGTGATGNNASLNPGLPAGLQGGDALLVFASIRNSGTGTPDTPTGYELLLSMSNACLFGKIADGNVGSGSTEAAPTVTFTGGAAGADTLAQCAAWRAVGLTVAASDTQLNSSAQNISYPSIDIDLNNCLVLYLGWKQDDWTSVATISGATEIGEVTSTAGSDAGQVWDYVQQTTQANIAAGSFTVTGGTSQISRGGVVALRTTVQTFTVTRSVNGVTKAQTSGTEVKLWRPGVTAL